MQQLSELATNPQGVKARLNLQLEHETSPGKRARLQYDLWRTCLVCGDEEGALCHLDHAMALDPVQSPAVRVAQAERRVVVLNAPGTFQSNAPLSFLFDDTTELHVVWVSADRKRNDRLVERIKDLQPDCVFIAIAEDTRKNAVIAEAGRIARETGLPVVNESDRIQQLSRSHVPLLLAGVPHVLVPECLAARWPFQHLPTFPLLVRPVFSHAGQFLRRVDSEDELELYIRATGGEQDYYITKFVNFMSHDGLYRKFRVVFVAGEPYPVHLAIHDDWAIWYYNARMEKFQERRAEEAHFMCAMEAYFSVPILTALRKVAAVIGLDYFGLDFGVLADGTVVVFEVETGMIVHDQDPEDIYPYKGKCIARIRHAVEAMIDRKAGRSRLSGLSDERR